MDRSSTLCAIVWLLAIPSTGFGQDRPEPLKLTVRPASGVHFVGQAIEFEVEVAAADSPVAFEAPKTSLAEVSALPLDPSRPAVGRFLVVARRTGPIEIAPFRARSGQRSGSSRTTRLMIANVPTEGRSAAFLGGVGAFEVRSEAEPTTLRAGQSLEFRIKLTGPAAWGSERPPDLSSGKPLGGDWRIENLPELVEGVDPRVRTFRYRLRPRTAGRFVLPPVSIAAFEPRTGRFTTRTTSGVPVVVEQPPRLDPNSLDYRPEGTTGEARVRQSAIGLGLGLAGLATVGLWWLARRRRRFRPAHPAQLARRLGRELAVDPEVETAKRVVEALTSYLEQVGDRSPGVLTPPEARAAFERLTNDREIAGLAERLVIACDRASYRGEREPTRMLSETGSAFFEQVAGVMRPGVPRSGSEGGPREAVETA